MVDKTTGPDKIEEELEEIRKLQLSEGLAHHTREIHRKKDVSGQLGSIVLAAGIIESKKTEIKNAHDTLKTLFDTYGEWSSPDTLEIQLPDDEMIIVSSNRDSFEVNKGAFWYTDTGVTKFPAKALRYTGRYISSRVPDDVYVFADGPKDTSIILKSEYTLSHRKLPYGKTFSELFEQD